MAKRLDDLICEAYRGESVRGRRPLLDEVFYSRDDLFSIEKELLSKYKNLKYRNRFYECIKDTFSKYKKK